MFLKGNRYKTIDLKQKLVFTLFVICFLFFGISAEAQCAMCRASLESTGDTTQVEAVNDGIVYLMIIPYVLVGIIGFAIYRMYRKKKETQ